VGGDWVGLTKFADPGVFVSHIAIRAASTSAGRCRPLRRLSDGATGMILHDQNLSNQISSRQVASPVTAQVRAWTARRARQREGARAAQRPSSP
jgi:hypothetical protein